MAHPRDKCPAKDAVCHRCNKKGHVRSQCRSKQVATTEPSATSLQPTATEDIGHLGTVTADIYNCVVHCHFSQWMRAAFQDRHRGSSICNLQKRLHSDWWSKTLLGNKKTSWPIRATISNTRRVHRDTPVQGDQSQAEGLRH